MKLPIKFDTKILIQLIYKIYIPIVILLTLVALVGYYQDISVAVFTRDPAVTVIESKISPFIDPKYNPFLGIVSQVGVLFWCITASLCIFCSRIISQKNYLANSWTDFLRFFGFLTLILLLDDLFLLHESVIPELFKIPEKITYLGYMSLCIWGLIKFRQVILKTEWIILLLSFFWFFCSIITDSLPFLRSFYYIQYLLEDGFKLLGIVSWFYYFLRVCLQSLKTYQDVDSRIRVDL